MCNKIHPAGTAKDEEKEDEGDEVVMNNLMHDIKEGFIQRRLPDGGFKVGRAAISVYNVDLRVCDYSIAGLLSMLHGRGSGLVPGARYSGQQTALRQ